MAKLSHVQVRTLRGAADALLCVPDQAGPFPAVIVWPDLAGLRPVFADIAQRLAGEGYVVLVPNAFYRSVTLDGTSVTASERLDFGGTMQRGAPWRAAASDAEIISDTISYIAFLDALPQTAQHTPVGMLGVDIGGAHAFIGARAKPRRVKAVAAIHPLSVATTRETSPHLFVDQSSASYLVDIAASDDAREPEDKTDLRNAFASAGLSAEVRVSAGGHGFFVADDPQFDESAAAQSWSAISSLFAASLR